MSFSLNQIADEAGGFAILAMDQRGTLRQMLDRAGRPSADEDLSAFKVDVISALSPLASGVLTDAEYGVAAARAAGAFAPGVGLLIAADQSPQPIVHGRRVTVYDPERGPVFVAANGGSALKFLIRWDPDDRDTGKTLDVVRAVVADCRAYGMPSVIEPLVKPEPTPERVMRSAALLAALEPDLLKLEWPGDARRCRELTKTCGDVPWALLSAGVAYELFTERVLTAVAAGARGYIAGRAFWGEAVALAGDERREFLRTTAADRMARLNAALAARR